MKARWQDRAACKDQDTTIWFPMGNHRKARQFCDECPVAKECLNMAMEAEWGLPIAMRAGVFGGEGPNVRVQLEAVRRATREKARA